MSLAEQHTLLTAGSGLITAEAHYKQIWGNAVCVACAIAGVLHFWLWQLKLAAMLYVNLSASDLR